MTVIDIVRENFKARTDIQTELRSIDEAATKDNRAYTDDEVAAITEKRSQLEAIDGRIQANLEMEVRSQEIANGMDKFLGAIADRDGEVVDTRSIGQRFASDDYRSWAESGAMGSFRMEFPGIDYRAVTDTTEGQPYASTSAGTFTRPERIARIGQDFLDRRVFITDVIPHLNTTQNAIEYVQDKTPLADIADKPAEVSEGGSKPQAGLTTAVINEVCQTIPAWVNITRQTAADIPMVQSYLDGRLRYALKRRLDKQVLNGDGSSPNLKGLINRSGILTNAPGSSEARYVTIRHSIRLMEDNESVPEIIVLNPADAELFDLSNSTTAGLHAVNALTDRVVTTAQGDGGGDPVVGRTAWGLIQVRSTAIASGTALLVDPMAVSIVDRQSPTAYMTDSHASNFTANILTLLLELRAGLALFDPKGIMLATFNGTT